jgi:hypothetical protein
MAGVQNIMTAKYQAAHPKSCHPVRLDLSAESAAIQQYFFLTINQRTVLSATINQRNEQAVYLWMCSAKGTKQTHATDLTKSSGIRSMHFKGNRHKSDTYITVRTTEKLSAHVFLNIKTNTQAHKTSSTRDFSYNGNPGLWQKEILSAMFWRIHCWLICCERKILFRLKK